MANNYDEAVKYGSNGPPSQAAEPEPAPKIRKQLPQRSVDTFWNKFMTKYPGKVLSVLPSDAYAKTKASKTERGVVHGQVAAKSYDQAFAECKHAVEKIAKECRRVNHKYRDAHFDIEWDLKNGPRDCLDTLKDEEANELDPKSVKRVTDIFDKPQFYEDGPTANDVRQGNNGDCWFLSAVCALCNKQDLIEKVCVARDEAVGVYGFVFHRDGEWCQTIIDDKLYLLASDWWESTDAEKATFAALNRVDTAEKYRLANQTGSKALYFAQCSNENETWLPLLEKAFAKAHGDFGAIEGGFTGEAIEDLTGGVTTEIFTADILDKNKFWSQEIMKVNQEFLFGCFTGTFDEWQDSDVASRIGARENIVHHHAYSIMEAREVKGHRLLRVRNPWGMEEWKGPWSDGSEQWTPEWMEILNHKFGDDGVFWISYEDLLRNYSTLERTRLFGSDWQITQQWTTVDVPWTADYNDTKFSITLKKRSPVVIVLSQLDDRYFKGLTGQYSFELHFRLDKDGENDYIVRSHGNYSMRRSVSTDIDLDPGTYSVLMRITATRSKRNSTPEDMIRSQVGRQNKLIQVGLAYDLAHAKGVIRETETEKQDRKAREEKKKSLERKKLREEKRKQMLAEWEYEKRRRARDKRQAKKREAYRQKKAAKAKAAEGSVAGDASSPIVNGATAAAGVEGQIEKEAAAGATEANTGEPAPDPSSLPSPPADTQPADTTTAEEEATTNDKPSPAAEESKLTTDPSNTNDDPSSTTDAAQKSQQFEKALQSIPSVTINGQPAPGSVSAPPPPQSIAAPSTLAPNDGALDDPYDYRYDSDASFDSSIDSVLDLPRDLTNEDEDTDSRVGGGRKKDDYDGEDLDEEANKEFENDPWNAVCVVGLRVYSKDEHCCVQVVRPREEEETLDLDDVSKGASGEVEEEKKRV
ncbi:hypothetical protein ACLMJK_007945 [Lecanora helva]